MRTFAVFLLVLVGAAGCGTSDKKDNSNIQTPNDQPIGAPKQLGVPIDPAAQPAQLGKDTKNQKPLQTIEIKQ